MPNIGNKKGGWWCKKCKKEDNAAAEESKSQQEKKQKELDEKRLEGYKELYSIIHEHDDDLSKLPYVAIKALIENLEDFPNVINNLKPEEYAVREKLYKLAFFNSNIQSGLLLQTIKILNAESFKHSKILNGINNAFGNRSILTPGTNSPSNSNAAILAAGLSMKKLNEISDDVSEINDDVSDLNDSFGGF